MWPPQHRLCRPVIVMDLLWKLSGFGLHPRHGLDRTYEDIGIIRIMENHIVTMLLVHPPIALEQMRIGFQVIGKATAGIDIMLLVAGDKLIKLTGSDAELPLRFIRKKIILLKGDRRPEPVQ